MFVKNNDVSFTILKIYWFINGHNFLNWTNWNPTKLAFFSYWTRTKLKKYYYVYKMTLKKNVILYLLFILIILILFTSKIPFYFYSSDYYNRRWFHWFDFQVRFRPTCTNNYLLQLEFDLGDTCIELILL